MCEYCEDYKLDKKEIYKDDNGAYLKLNEHSTKILWIDDQKEISAEIKFCPMCGRPLNGKYLDFIKNLEHQRDEALFERGQFLMESEAKDVEIQKLKNENELLKDQLSDFIEN